MVEIFSIVDFVEILANFPTYVIGYFITLVLTQTQKGNLGVRGAVFVGLIWHLFIAFIDLIIYFMKIA